MPIKVMRKAVPAGTARHVCNDVYETTRFLLAGDGAGVTVTDIVLAPGIEADYGDDRYIEIAYCLEGRVGLVDHAGGERYEITPGTLWVAKRGDRFNFHAEVPTRLVCLFNPAFDGHETGFAGDP